MDLVKECYNSNRDYLVKVGLSPEEALSMLEMFKKMKIPAGDEADFYNELEDGLAFEGGMSFTESIISAALALEGELKPREEHPFWDHPECDLCTYLGSFLDTDLYHCLQAGFPTVMVRYGHGASDYASGLHFGIQKRDDPESPIGEAYRRALAKGLDVLPKGGLAPNE